MTKTNKALVLMGAFLLLASSASAVTVTYSTNTAGTLFTFNNLLVLNQTSGAAATLTFTPNISSTTGTPSNINYGDFKLVCPLCTTQAAFGGAGGSIFGEFYFHLIVNDTTDNAFGMFTGHSMGGAVWSDVSQIGIAWTPLQLGPGTLNAIAGGDGSFNETIFRIQSPSGIVAPNSGTPVGVTTIQGDVSDNAVPEPVTMALFGSGLLALGLVRRFRRS